MVSEQVRLAKTGRVRVIVFVLFALIVAATVPDRASATEESPAANLSAVLEADSGAASVQWSPREGLSDPGSYRLRVRHPGEEWGSWVPLTNGGLEVGNSVVGDRLRVQVKRSGSGEVLWAGKVFVIPEPTCVPNEVTSGRPNPRQVVEPLPASEPSVSLALSDSESIADVSDALEGDAAIQQMISTTRLPNGQTYTAGLTTDPNASLESNLATFRQFVSDDAKAYSRELDAEPSSADVEGSAEMLSDVASDFESPQTATVDQIVLTGSIASLGDSLESLPADPSTVETQDAASNCSGNEPAAMAQGYADNPSSPSALQGNSFDPLGGPDFEPRSYKDYTPREITVKTFNQIYRNFDDSRQEVRKAVVSFTWCEACTRFWRDLYDISHEHYDRSGVEVQLNYGFDYDGNLWGSSPWWLPSSEWGGDQIPRGSTEAAGGVTANGIPRAWSANFPCPYADDYTADIESIRNVAIGSFCPPGSFDGTNSRWRWAHLLLPDADHDDDNESVRPAVQPVREVLFTGVEQTYCNARGGVRAACMFGVRNENGEGGESYVDYYRLDAELDPKYAITPGSAKFFRADLAAGATGWNTNPLAQCVDKGTFISYNLALPEFNAVQQNLAANFGAFSWAFPYDPAESGVTSEFLEGIIQPYVGITGLTVDVLILPGGVDYETRYVFSAASDLGLPMSWGLLARRFSFDTSETRRYLLEPGMDVESDSHSAQYRVYDSLVNGFCVPREDEPPT